MTTRRVLLAGFAAACATEPNMPSPQIFELRNYLVQPGRRDELIDTFEEHFIESQEALGICVAGTFRNLDDPDRFVWIRSFPDFATRQRALDAFYTGPVWQEHRTAANATMIDSDNVLLLRAYAVTLLCNAASRPPIGATAIPASVFAVATYYLAPSGEQEFGVLFERAIAPRLRENGGDVRATFVSELRGNNYPRLPVRENVNVFVSVTRFASLQAQESSARDLGAVARDIASHLVQPTETFRLQPTARSLLR